MCTSATSASVKVNLCAMKTLMKFVRFAADEVPTHRSMFDRFKTPSYKYTKPLTANYLLTFENKLHSGASENLTICHFVVKESVKKKENRKSYFIQIIS